MSPATGRHGRVAVVTGAARGLGEHLALALAAQGWTLALVGHEPDRLEQVAQACGNGSRAWACDVTDAAGLGRVAAQVRQELGPASAVVANAGIALGAPLALADGAAFDRVIEVNLLGSVRTARAFLDQLVETRGYYLQIASLAALVPVPAMASYCASKAGVEAFAHSVAPELEHRGVRVGVAYLSWVDTDMVRGADESPALASMRASLPPPFNLTATPEQAGEALARGVRRRKRHVYVPGWVRLVRANPTLAVAFTTSRVGVHRARLAEMRLREETTGPIARPTGAGGAADRAATSR